MGKGYKAEARRVIERAAQKHKKRQPLNYDILDLKEAHFWYYRDNYVKCGNVLYALARRLIDNHVHYEPEENENGKGQSQNQDEQQEEEGEHEIAAERDADGYLIRE